MAQPAPVTRRVDSTATQDATLADTASANLSTRYHNPSEQEKDKVLPLPGWLVKVYFIFPVVLYIPDAIFNFFVYSDGISPHSANPVLNIAFDVLWAFLALGVVGMAYLLSVLAPWHWGQGHRVQAFFCAVGVLVATAITTWCSLAFRSQTFKGFVTDQWVYSLWPQLRSTHFSLTMLLVAIAPPFWGLFWAVVQPTSNRRSLREIEESHQERLLRTQQEAELKQLKAETSAKVREAQLRGMASTAAAARKQAAQFISQRKSDDASQQDDEKSELSYSTEVSSESQAEDLASDPDDAANVFQLPALTGRGGDSPRSIMNHAVGGATAGLGSRTQPSLRSDVDVEGSLGMPASDAFTMAPRRPPMLGGSLTPAINPLEISDDEGMTGTTGPRPALRRVPQGGTLVSAMNGPNPLHVQAVMESMRELNIPVKSTLTPKQTRLLVPEVAQKLDTDESFAKAVIGRVLKSETSRGNS
jgi:hypothetical protein